MWLHIYISNYSYTQIIRKCGCHWWIIHVYGTYVNMLSLKRAISSDVLNTSCDLSYIMLHLITSHKTHVTLYAVYVEACISRDIQYRYRNACYIYIYICVCVYLHVWVYLIIRLDIWCDTILLYWRCHP